MNDSKAAGIFDETKGKVKQAVGETFNDQSMANEGAADQVKGHAEQTWGKVKDTAHDLTTSDSADQTKADAEAKGHNFREEITSAAEHVKDSISRGLDSLKHKAND